MGYIAVLLKSKVIRLRKGVENLTMKHKNLEEVFGVPEHVTVVLR